MARYINPFTDFGLSNYNMEYEESLKQLRDLKNVLRTAEKDAAKKADAKARKEEQEKSRKQIEKARQEKARREQEKIRKEEQEKTIENTHNSIREFLALNVLTPTQIAKALNISEKEVLKIKNNQF